MRATGTQVHFLTALLWLFWLPGAFGADIPKDLTADAVRSLVADPSFTDYKGLTAAIARAPERDLRIYSYQWIAQKNKIEAFDPFLEAYKTEDNPLVKGVLLSSLGEFATQTKRNPNWNGIGSPNVPQLDKERQAHFVEMLRSEARPGNPQPVRLSAIHRMGQLRLAGAEDFLLESTKDPSPRIRGAALSSIRFFGGTEHQNLWLKQLREGSPELRQIAVDILGGLDDSELDGPLEEVARGGDVALAASAKSHLEFRAKRKERQQQFQRAMHPSAGALAFSKVVNAVLSGGWYVVAALIFPAIFTATWAFRNKEYETLAAASFFLVALLIGVTLWWSKSRISGPSEMLLIVLGGSALLSLPVMVRLVKGSSRTATFDALVTLGFVLIASMFAFKEKGMPIFVWASITFAVTAVFGAVQAGICLRKGESAAAAHCLAYASIVALLLGCMPFAFSGM